MLPLLNENAKHEIVRLSFFFYQPAKPAMGMEDIYCINNFPFNRVVHLALL